MDQRHAETTATEDGQPHTVITSTPDSRSGHVEVPRAQHRPRVTNRRATGRSLHDPLAAVRHDDDPEFDVFLTGTVFFEIVFIGLEAAPKTGTEVWASGMGSGPGGVANLAVACSVSD